MKLNSLSTLRQLDDMPSLHKKHKEVKNNNLSDIDIIVYSVNLCLYSARILRGEIKVKNRDAVLQTVGREVIAISNLMSKKNWYYFSDYTHTGTKKFLNQLA